MRDLMYAEATLLNVNELPSRGDFNNRQVGAVVEVFTANMVAVLSLGHVLPRLMYASARHQLWATQACFEIHDKAELTAEEQKNPAIYMPVMQRATELSAQAARKDIANVSESYSDAMLIGVNNLTAFLRVNPDSLVESGTLALLSSMLLGCWTAFEVFATDLWVEAVNLRPRPLGLSAINGQQRKDDDDLADQQTQKKDEKLRFMETMIVDHPESCGDVGVAIKRTRKFDFNRLFGITEAFRCAFGSGEVDAMFSQDFFRELSVLEGVRNVVVHRGGIIDFRFHQRAQRQPELYGRYGLDKFNKGQKIVPDGVLVRGMGNAVIRSGAALAKFVEGWLQTHPAV